MNPPSASGVGAEAVLGFRTRTHMSAARRSRFTGFQTGSEQAFFVYRSAIDSHNNAIIMPYLCHNYGILRHFCKNPFVLTPFGSR